MAEGQEYCLKCGVPAVPSAEKIDKGDTVSTKEEKGEGFSLGLFIWAIVNTLLCSAPAGIIALVFSLLAKYEDGVKAQNYNKVAKISNIIGTAIGVIVAVIVIFAYVMMFAMLIGISAGASGSMYY